MSSKMLHADDLVFSETVEIQKMSCLYAEIICV